MKKNIISRIASVLILLIFISACSGSKSKETKDEVMVFAAASLTDVLSELVEVYENNHLTKIKLNLASSGTLARQIVQGGEADIYLSASKKWADYADSLGYIKNNLRSDIAMNELVLIVPNNSTIDSITINKETDFVSLLGQGRLSIGDPSHVPAGRYAKQSLDNLNAFNGLKEKLLPSKDVRSALMMVELGEAPLGIVYRTDALKSGKVKIAGPFPEESHKPIVYVAGVCNAKQNVVQFYEFLNSSKALPNWQKYGFKK
ncbi:molybdate ABC transporter substrate-binding protein [Carboxylicivirga linearis]|uniref:Molybdate ABC transporter substrate-binding protein n=1 Tax=Carboxylicivirga linearis TaxID=1628157 RepID=A0ABS5K0E3_9BACT|nr:molybdate ABC transporter substrate-binding protein [Carboxylicivirga linearis]MBS2100635.1 molybdate ABC transporter substrate-binding protein [Carboxylicivirga linearis]